MATNPFKAFTPFLIPKNTVTANEADLEDHEVVDPSGSQWRSYGFTKPLEGEDGLMKKLQGGLLLCVQFAERILPGKVRDEVLKKRKDRIEESNGRKMGKKEYAELRDEVEHEMLPKAFIRRTSVFCVIRPYDAERDLLLIFNTSQKRLDDICALLTDAYSGLPIWKFATESPMVPGLTTLAQDEFVVEKTGAIFSAGDSAVLKGEEKKTIRVKDKDIGESDIQALLKQDYRVHELAVEHSEPEEDEPIISFVVNENLCFKKVEVASANASSAARDFAGFFWLSMKGISDMLDSLIEMWPLATLPTFGEDDEL